MAGKLIITRGLPASGKSRWAAEYAAAHPEARVVTMDDIRTAIGSVFEAGDESIVQAIRDFTIRRYLEKGYMVISADTNLHPRTFKRLDLIADSLGCETEVVDFTYVSLETCLARNGVRWAEGDQKVPDQAIVKMHERYLAHA